MCISLSIRFRGVGSVTSEHSLHYHVPRSIFRMTIGAWTFHRRPLHHALWVELRLCWWQVCILHSRCQAEEDMPSCVFANTRHFLALRASSHNFGTGVLSRNQHDAKRLTEGGCCEKSERQHRYLQPETRLYLEYGVAESVVNT
jgi:hypothetical protein